jgi:hypothetical protein
MFSNFSKKKQIGNYAGETNPRTAPFKLRVVQQHYHQTR